eukprot:194200_1
MTTDSQSTKIVKLGYVRQKGFGIFSGWKRRYIVLKRNKKLCYYIDQTLNDKKKEMLNLAVLTTDCVKPSNKSYNSKHYGFCIIFPDRTHYLAVDSLKKQNEWIKKLRETIQISSKQTNDCNKEIDAESDDDFVIIKTKTLKPVKSLKKNVYKNTFENRQEHNVIPTKQILNLTKKVNEQQKLSTDQISIIESKLAELTNKKREKYVENVSNNINMTLINELINDAPNIDSNDKQHNSGFDVSDMVSCENLRDIIKDLIQSNNQILCCSDIVSENMIHITLNKWRYNLNNLYLKLLDEYKMKSIMDTKDINENIHCDFLFDKYSVGETIALGTFGAIKFVTRSCDSKVFAAKFIGKESFCLLNEGNLNFIRYEIAIMRELNHENIIQMYDIFEGNCLIGLIFNLCIGRKLLDIIVENGTFSENIASQCFVQICQALMYIHSKNIAHRDIKPDNFLFTVKINDMNDKIPHNALKLIDFGLAGRCTNCAGLNEYCGSPIYMSPEIYCDKEYGYACDIWAAGCILYAMLVGYAPFDMNEDNDVD